MGAELTNRRIGDAGEAAAARYLMKKGYKIVVRNFRCRTGEIDIIAYDGDCLVFVEVKTRRSVQYGRPAEFVDKRKRRRIISAAYMYLRGEEPELRFDVIEVMYRMNNERPYIYEINHIKNAFINEE